VIDSSAQHAADTAYHNSLVELGKRLLACAKEGDTEGVRQLMSRGAPFTTDWLGTSPLHLTALYGREETCEVLLKAGCSRDARTKVDKTPLHVAAQEGNTTICQLLLEQGADVDAKDMLRMTPLHWAVERGCSATVEFLLRHGANTQAESKFDKTPLEIASENGRPDIFEMLQNAEQYRVVAMDPGGASGPSSLVCQQEVVTTATKAEANIQYIKHELEALQEQGGLQEIALDPIQIALGESGVADVDSLTLEHGGLPTSQEDALKLLASHGITMLGSESEAPVTPNSLSLTEAGRLALFSSTRGVPARAAPARPVTKVVTLHSKPVQPPAASALAAAGGKAPRVIKLTPAQFAAIKKGKSGQIVLPALSSQGRRETITLKNPSTSSSSSNIALSSPVPPRKVARLEGQGEARLEMQRRLQRQLEEKEREKDRYRREMQKREEEAERIKEQLKALGS